MREVNLGICAMICTFFSSLFGVFDPVLQLLVYVMVLDFLTGVFNAAITRTFDRRTALIGAATKLMYLLIVGLGARLDATGVYAEPIARTALAWGIVIIEVGSIINNFDRIGIPIPDWLRNMLDFISKKGAAHE